MAILDTNSFPYDLRQALEVRSEATGRPIISLVIRYCTAGLEAEWPRDKEVIIRSTDAEEA